MTMSLLSLFSALVFNEQITLGNIIEIVSLIGMMLFGYAALRERSRTNAHLIKELNDRMDRCDIEQIKERTNTMWILQLRRGLVEAEVRGLGSSQSPFKLTEAAKGFLQPLMPQLKSFYKEIDGDSLGLIELADALELTYGDAITKEVCKRVIEETGDKVTNAACLVLAIAQLRPISLELINEAAEQNIEDHKRNLALRDLPVKHEVKGGYSWLRK